jgi:hypothetical protein
MMDKTAYQARISQSLQTVERQRQHSARNPAFALHLARLKRFQAERLRSTYADLHAQPRYRAAVEFFTQDLYGERDFSQRDADLQRIVPAVAKLFALEAVAMLDAALRLHALAEELDAAMCEHNTGPWREESYRIAWQATGREAERFVQLTLIHQVGEALDKLVKLPMIGLSLKAMSGPAAVAGLGELHGFLSRGFEAFKALHGAKDFLDCIETRETALMRELFQA